MRIRAATRADSTELGTMLVELCEYETRFDPLLEPKEGCDRYLVEYTWRGVERGGGVVFLAEDDGRPVGFISGWVVRRDGRLWRVTRLGYVDALYVRDGWRGRGVGRGLMRALIDHFRGLGLDHLTTDVYSSNERARSFYASFNMSPATVKVEGPMPAER